jgi:signal transduction histidine kinase
VSLFKLGEKTIRLYSLQSIKNELEAKEIESWQQMTRVLAHEISNSVTPVSTLGAGIHRKLSQAYLDPDQGLQLSKVVAKDLIQSASLIEQRGTALVEFVENYKSFSRLPDPSMESMDLANFFSRLSKFFKEELDEHQVKLIFDLTDEIHNVHVDPNLMQQAFINLIRNSMLALSDRTDGKIILKAARSSDHETILEVSDNGHGIPEEIQSQVFIPFFTTRPKGTGIGLSIVKKIVLMHGGSIQFRSNRESGTTFLIKLPAQDLP